MYAYDLIKFLNNPTLATSCEALTHWKKLWSWEGLGPEGEGDDRGGDGWVASPTPGVHANSCPSSQWCHSAISSSIVPFSSCPQSLPASGSFPMSQLPAWGGQSIRVSASTSVLPMNTQDWSPLEWTGWISLQSKGLSRVFSNSTAQKNHSSALSFLHSLTLTSIHDHCKNHSLD